MTEARVSFRSGKLSLEGMLSAPKGTGPFPAAVVCHPHPSMGGSMENNVVKSICTALVRKSIVTLRFNFRGVGVSEGSFGHGVGEQDDVKAAIKFLSAEKQVDSRRLAFAGYSAGAVFGLPVAVKDTNVWAFAAISLPLGMMDVEDVKTSPKSKLFVWGSKDDYTTAGEVTEFCESCIEPKQCAIVEGADHFWEGHERAVAKTVSDFLSASLARSM